MLPSEGLTCEHVNEGYLAINTDEQSFAIFSFYPYQSGKQTCGFVNSDYSLTDAEAKSCILQLLDTVDYFKLTCSDPSGPPAPLP